MDKVLEAIKKASTSVASLLNDIAEDENNDIKVNLTFPFSIIAPGRRQTLYIILKICRALCFY